MQFWQSSQWEMESRSPLLEFRWTYDLLVANTWWQSEVLMRPGQKRQWRLAHWKILLGDLSLGVRSPTCLRFPCSKQIKAHSGGSQWVLPDQEPHMWVSEPSYISGPKPIGPFLYIFPSSQLRPSIDQLLISWLRESMSTHYNWGSLLGNSSNRYLWHSVLPLTWHVTCCHVICKQICGLRIGNSTMLLRLALYLTQ